MIRLLLAALITAILVLGPSEPSVAALECPLFFAGDPNTPEAAKKSLEENAQSAVAICIYKDLRPEISSVTQPIRGTLGVCIFSTFDGTDSETYMLRTPSKCPEQDNRGYMKATGMSEGIFVALTELAHRISSSPAEFDRALQSAAKFRREKREFDAIRLAVTSRPPQGYEFLGVSLDIEQHYQYRLEYGAKPDCNHGIVYGGRGVTLYVDLTADGLRIVDMEQWGITSGIRCLENSEFDYWGVDQK